MSKPVSIFLAAGGTGGHIYPALALAKAIRKVHPEARIRFVGTRTGLETQLVPREGYELRFLSIGRLNSNVPWTERLWTLLKLPLSFVQSAWLLLFLRPQLVLGVGGHASGPLLLVASLLGFRTAIWEPNAIPGLANRILARFVGARYVVFPETGEYLHPAKIEVVGLPVRQEIEALAQTPYHPHPVFRILVVGGSQGARALNTVVMETFRDQRWSGRVEVVHQTGRADFERIREGYGFKCSWVQATAYLHDMDKQYADCDFVIARSGTGTLSELAAAHRPSLLVPLPTAADNHQQKNAEVFVRANAADMILQKDLNFRSLGSYIESIVSERGRLETMSKAVSQFFTPRAADLFAEKLLR